MIPDFEFDSHVGNTDLKDYLSQWLKKGKGKQPNLLITGDPGTGKTTSAVSFFRRLLGDSALGLRDDDFTDWLLERHDYRFLVIRGATVTESFLKQRVAEAADPGYATSAGVYVLIDELGEIWSKRIEMGLRELLEADHVTTIATAQDFKGQVRAVENEHERKRWLALDRRFPVKIHTQLPAERELAVFLAGCLSKLRMSLDEPRTLITLARKFDRNPSLVLNVIIAAHARGRERLTAEDVADA